MRFLSSITAIAIALSSGRPVAAEDNAKKEAKIEFEKGVRHFKAERYEDAALAFRGANRLAPSWKLFYNIGQSEAALKNYGLALEAFERYLAEGGDEIAKERQAAVREELDRLRDMVGTVEIKGIDGDEIVVDNRVRGTLPAAARLKVAMGDVAVTIKRNGESVISREFKISAGEVVNLDATTGEIKTGTAVSEDAEAKTEPSIGRHLVHVITNPPEKKAAFDGKGGWRRTPYAFPATPGGHLVELKGGVGYRNKKIPLVVENTDLTVEAEMDRPVFQAGIIMTAAGGALAILGGIWIATFDPEDMNFDNDGFTNAVSVTGVSSASLIAGIFMMIFDKQRDTIFHIAPGAPKQ